MRIFKTIKSLRKFLKSQIKKNKTIGFVPTMGALHRGHESLINHCRRENDIVVLSVFINPKQFSPKEDYQKYPRQEKKDKMFARQMNVDIIFYPSEKEMYPNSFLTYVEIGIISQKLCGQFRSNHFKGVATIVVKLLNIVNPNNLYLGQKDFQQVIILKKMVRDLNIPVRVRVCPTVRTQDGLALSSRNQHLSKTHRLEAPVLYKALKFGKKLVKNNRLTPQSLSKKITLYIQENSSAKIQYVQCVNKEDLTTPQRLEGQFIIAIATYFGKTRLIDNIKCKI